MTDDSAERWLDAGCPPGVTPRYASTVMVLRDPPTGGGVEVFLQRRVASMAFAPSMWVFPGGGVDRRDAEADVPWAGPGPDEWARRLDVPIDIARALVCAAVREVFEECGVLLAGPDGNAVVADVAGEQWHARRAALLSRELSLGGLLSAEGLVLRSDLLSLQDHWITPEFEPKRYDTYFFAALLPQGQRADDETTEADLSQWLAPRQLLAEHAAGRARMLPPTSVNLERLAAAADAPAVVGSSPQVRATMPVAVREAGAVVLRVQPA